MNMKLFYNKNTKASYISHNLLLICLIVSYLFFHKQNYVLFHMIFMLII